MTQWEFSCDCRFPPQQVTCQCARGWKLTPMPRARSLWFSGGIRKTSFLPPDLGTAVNGTLGGFCFIAGVMCQCFRVGAGKKSGAGGRPKRENVKISTHGGSIAAGPPGGWLPWPALHEARGLGAAVCHIRDQPPPSTSRGPADLPQGRDHTKHDLIMVAARRIVRMVLRRMPSCAGRCPRGARSGFCLKPKAGVARDEAARTKRSAKVVTGGRWCLSLSSGGRLCIGVRTSRCRGNFWS
jgi:hypothetical protein